MEADMAHQTQVIGSLNVLDHMKDRTVGTLRVNITGMKRFRIRTAMCLALLRLARWVCPARLDVECD